MVIETKNKEVVIRIPSNISFDFLQDLIDYITVKTNLAKSKAAEKEIENLSEKIKADWWKKNKARFIK